MDHIPERGIRAALIQLELYAELPPERIASAYTLITAAAEERANALIGRWLEEAYHQGQEDAEYARQRAEDADRRDFLATARTISTIVERGTTRTEADLEALNRGEGEDHPGGSVPVWGEKPPRG